MEFNKITAAEAAALIENGQTIGLSGFTPAGTPKCTPAEIAKKAEAEHEAGRPFKISIISGASSLTPHGQYNGMACGLLLAGTARTH